MSDTTKRGGARDFTIGEVSKECDVPQHVLRYWEKQFVPLQNLTRRNGRRYYTEKDVQFVKSVKTLLYDQGLRISGAKIQLNEPQKPVAQVNLFNVEQKVKAAIADLKRAKAILYEE